MPLDEPEPAFTIYEDIRQKLIAQGMPAEQIAFIHEANTEVRKKNCFPRFAPGRCVSCWAAPPKWALAPMCRTGLWRSMTWTARGVRETLPSARAVSSARATRTLLSMCTAMSPRELSMPTCGRRWRTNRNSFRQIMTSKSPVRSCDDVDETALSFAEIKALCAGDPRIKERMDLDVEVAKLKLMKADHQSKQYRLEDQLLKYFPQEIETNKGFIQGFEADLETLAAHPHPEDGFAGMEIRGDVLTDKENAGAALLDACKEVKTSDPVQIGSYRGFTMSVEFSAWKQEYTLLLKGQMTHRATLGTDPRGNLTRIDNALAQMPQRLEAVKNQLDNLYQQQAAAKEEVGKPFPYEEDLRVKSARLVELDTLAEH